MIRVDRYELGRVVVLRSFLEACARHVAAIDAGRDRFDRRTVALIREGIAAGASTFDEIGRTGGKPLDRTNVQRRLRRLLDPVLDRYDVVVADRNEVVAEWFDWLIANRHGDCPCPLAMG